MDRTLTQFIAALRNAGIRVSTAETLDAMHTVERVGYRDRDLLKNSLSPVLAKTANEKDSFATAFDRFFSFEGVSAQALAGGAGEASGDGQGSGIENKNSKTKGGDEAAEDASHGGMAQPRTALGRLLMQDRLVELTVSMAAAAQKAKLQDIQVFTQKGLYARKIMDAMGLADLLREIGSVKQSRRAPEQRLGQHLEKRRDWLREQVRDYVERQFLLHADATGRRLREGLLQKAKLSNIEQRNFRLGKV